MSNIVSVGFCFFTSAAGRRTESQRNHPWEAVGNYRGQAGHRPSAGGSQSAQHLEEEVQRLSQMVLDMQARMTDMSSNLRMDFQEDASKMLLTLLSGARQPASATGSEAQTLHVQDLSFASSSAQINEAMSRISQVENDLDFKSDTLQDLVGRVSRHDQQLHLLMEERGQTATPTSFSPTATTVGDLDLKDYLDEKIGALREELMEGMDIKMADMKNSCDYKILSVQEQCEGQETNYLSLAELMESKESDLRKEIQDLRVLIDAPGGVKTTQVSHPLLARVENLEVRLNSFEKTGCSTVEDKLKAEWVTANQELKHTLEAKLASVEVSLSSLLTDTRNVSPSTEPPAHQDVQPKDHGIVKESLQELRSRFKALERLCSNSHQGGAAENSGEMLGHMDGRIRRLEGLCGRLEPMAESVRGIGDGLSRHVADLWDCMNQLNTTVADQVQDLGLLKGACQCIPTASRGHVKAATDTNLRMTGEQQGLARLLVSMNAEGRFL